MSDWILEGDAAASSPHAGGKARALARAARAGLPVPPWFVLSAAAFHDSIAPSHRGTLEDSDALHAITDALRTASLAPHVEAALRNAVHALCPNDERLAVRSSASDEDGVEHSFAGQLESCLFVHPSDVTARVIAVWRSAFSPRILAYRREHGLPLVPHPPGVLIQRMIEPRAAGVAFSADPVSARRGIAVVSAVPGVGSAVVSGEADADTWLVDRSGTITERRIVRKHRMHVADPGAEGGVRLADVPPDRVDAPALSDEEVGRVAAMARRAARHFARPQDIEWAIADRLYLLQSRPITSLRARPDPDARTVLWDNSNIVESYSGVTTPLTFSFAREIYEHVYRQFCRMMGVPERVIAREDEMFRNMLGLIRGRLYYNLLSWYRLLAMLPGYQVNRRFMEQMMGVKEPLPEALDAHAAAGLPGGRVSDSLHALRSVARLLLNQRTLNRRVDAFCVRLERALAEPVPPLEDRRIDELAAHYEDLRGQLLLRWDAPILNDFFAMIYYGILRSLVIRWCDDPGGTLQNDLIGGEGGIVSAEPAVRMQRMARIAAHSPGLREQLAYGSLADVEAVLHEHAGFAREYRDYLMKFGERTVNELKLESTTLHDDPLPLLRSVAALAEHPEASTAIGPTAADRLRAESRQRVGRALASHPIRRIVFDHVLRNARRRVRDRENLRLERTRLFGRVRRIFAEIGRRLHAADRLDDPRDVFYLEVEEVLSYVEGRATTADLRGLAAVRKREFAEYAGTPPPPDRFETHGPPYDAEHFEPTRSPAASTGDTRTGLGCSPGLVRGPVQIVTDPTAARIEPGTILVAEHTDPGWIMVFPSARGVLVERGSLLSHAAIVARELGIPAVVSLPGLTGWLQNGDVVEMDGSTGVVSRIDSSGAPDA